MRRKIRKHERKNPLSGNYASKYLHKTFFCAPFSRENFPAFIIIIFRINFNPIHNLQGALLLISFLSRWISFLLFKARDFRLCIFFFIHADYAIYKTVNTLSSLYHNDIIKKRRKIFLFLLTQHEFEAQLPKRVFLLLIFLEHNWQEDVITSSILIKRRKQRKEDEERRETEASMRRSFWVTNRNNSIDVIPPSKYFSHHIYYSSEWVSGRCVIDNKKEFYLFI